MPDHKGASPDFRTSDLYFAAYLQTAGVEMKKTERGNDNGKVYFVFDTSIANIEELKTAWFNNMGKVPANPFSHAIKNLKSLCHNK
jgi:transposase